MKKWSKKHVFFDPLFLMKKTLKNTFPECVFLVLKMVLKKHYIKMMFFKKAEKGDFRF